LLPDFFDICQYAEYKNLYHRAMNAIQRSHVGIMQVLLVEFEQHKLPVLLKIKDKVDGGGQVSQGELEFLDKALENVGRTMPLMSSYPELHKFCQHVVRLYQDITVHALQNEKNKQE